MNTSKRLITKLPLFAAIVFAQACAPGGGTESVGAANSAAEIKKCSEIRYAAPSGVENDIVYTFSKPYACGQFANGDWWVSPESDLHVEITSISPSQSGGRNGQEINPSSQVTQGFDSRLPLYDESVTFSLPIDVEGDSSVVKSVSRDLQETNCRPCIQFAAVLTVVKSVMPNSQNFFRPGYFGTNKSFTPIDSATLDFFDNLSYECCGEAPVTSFESIAANYQHVRLDHIKGWQGRFLHPKDSMPDYGSAITTQNATALLRFLLDDFSLSETTHKQAIINYLQMALDLRSMALGGVRYSSTTHGSGRKLPLLFAAAVFRDSEISNHLATTDFGEDGSVYFSDVAGMALFGIECTEDEYWRTLRTGSGPRNCRDPYGYIDGGGHEIGDGYQFCCTAMPWKYTALAVRLLKLENEWDNQAFFDYVDRWVNIGAWASPDPCAPDSIAYQEKETSDCVPGSGRYTEKHGVNRDDGFYKNGFGDTVWAALRY